MFVSILVSCWVCSVYKFNNSSIGPLRSSFVGIGFGFGVLCRSNVDLIVYLADMVWFVEGFLCVSMWGLCLALNRMR